MPKGLFCREICRENGAGNGAGEGDRTLVCSLGSCRSTIELHPPGVEYGAYFNTAIGNSESPMITVSINGEPRQFPQAISVAAFIEEMGLTGKRIALERNGEIVPRSTFAAQQLADGDRLEVVVAVGGGKHSGFVIPAQAGIR